MSRCRRRAFELCRQLAVVNERGMRRAALVDAMEFTAEGALRRLLLLGLPLVAVGWTACGSGAQKCPAGCPAAYLSADIGVVTTPAVVVNGVEAVLTGPVNGTMLCQPNPPVVSVVCSWPPGTEVVPGNYSLQVSAPGYQMTTIQVEVTTPPPDQCGCSADSIKPSTVSISPADGSVD
jgi:hypothetical protein